MKKNLKKILLLVLVVLTCGFVSCKTTNKTRKTLNIKENANFMRVNKVVYPESKNSNEANGQKFITILKKFTNSTTKEIFKSNQNEIYSPISLYFALAMLYEACDGESALELENLLSINDKDLLRKELKTVYTNNYYNNELGTSEIANSIWVNKAYEVNKEYNLIIEKKAENLYRTISQKIRSLPTSNQAVKQSVFRTQQLELTPQESEQLSKYVSDDTYVKKQKEDIEELASMFKDMLGQDKGREQNPFIKE